MNAETVNELFARFRELRILIIGDVMVDNYIFGRVDRISPEAPVPVVKVSKRENRLGGAANVALNVKSLGATAVLCATVGHDDFGAVFHKLLEKEQLSTEGMLVNDRPTTVKTRIIGNNHQLLRVDEEDDSEQNSVDADQFQQHALSLIRTMQPDAVIFEDYDKGLIGEELIRAVVDYCRSLKIPVAVDPKKKNFGFYKGVTLFKPNLKELREGLKLDLDFSQPGSVALADFKLRGQLAHEISLITLSEAGIFASDALQSFRLPAHVRNVADVSGAGDTVISTATLCLAAGAELSLLALISNLAGGIVCEKVGVVPVPLAQLKSECLAMAGREGGPL